MAGGRPVDLQPLDEGAATGGVDGDVAARTLDQDGREGRAVHGQGVRAGGRGVEAEGRPDVPGRGGAQVVVARQPAGAGAEGLGHHLADRRGGAGWVAGVVVGPRHAVLGFVADVVVRQALTGVDLGEVVVEPLHGGLPAAHGVDQVGEVVGDHPGVLGGVALGEVALRGRVERPLPAAVGVARLGVARLGAEGVAPPLRPGHVGGVVRGVAEGLGELGDGEVGGRVLQ